MERDKENQAIGRRAFLKTASLGAGAAAAATVAAGTNPAAAATPAADDEGYRETEHVRRYYALAAKF